jgi:NMD protein affecting ribosome stability and mRNA decay
MFAWTPEELDFYKKWREAEYQEATLNEMLLEKDKQLLEKDNVISEKDNVISEKDNSLRKAILKLRSLGISEREIAETLNITVEIIAKLTN